MHNTVIGFIVIIFIIIIVDAFKRDDENYIIISDHTPVVNIEFDTRSLFMYYNIIFYTPTTILFFMSIVYDMDVLYNQHDK